MKTSDVTNYWDDYWGSNQTNINPRTGLADNDRIFTADETRSIRFGDSIIEIETIYDERFYDLKNSYVTIYVEKLNIYDQNL